MFVYLYIYYLYIHNITNKIINLHLNLNSCLYFSNCFYIIRFILWDSFGDGWNSANFHIFDLKGFYKKTAPDCGLIASTEEYCFDGNEADTDDADLIDDYLTVTVQGYATQQPWEVYYF